MMSVQKLNAEKTREGVEKYYQERVDFWKERKNNVPKEKYEVPVDPLVFAMFDVALLGYDPYTRFEQPLDENTIAEWLTEKAIFLNKDLTKTEFFFLIKATENGEIETSVVSYVKNAIVPDSNVEFYYEVLDCDGIDVASYKETMAFIVDDKAFSISGNSVFAIPERNGYYLELAGNLLIGKKIKIPEIGRIIVGFESEDELINALREAELEVRLIRETK